MTEIPEPELGRNLPLPFQGEVNLPAVRHQQKPVYYPEEKESISLEHYLHVLVRRKWMLAAIAITFAVLAAMQVFTATPMYRAPARLQIDPERSRIVPFQEVAGSKMAGGGFMEDYMWTQTENLQSLVSALRVVDRLDLKDSEAFNRSTSPGALVVLKRALFNLARQSLSFGEDSDARTVSSAENERVRLASKLQGGVEAQPIRNTRLIEVSYMGPDAQLAIQIANTLCEEFIEENLEGKYDATARAGDFLRVELEELQIEVEKTEQELLAYAQRNKIVNLTERGTDERSVQYNILKREVDSNKELYEGLLQRLKEAGVAVGLRSSSIRIVNRAKVPTRSAPRRARTLALSLILGLLVGTGIVFLMEALDNTLKTSDDVTHHLGLPALGVVPSLDASSKVSHRIAWPFVKKSSAETRPHLVQSNEDLQQAPALEAYRSLRTALLLSNSCNPPQAILVTSAMPGEGKSTTAANIAVALAQSGDRTLIVDLDMREPNLGEAFGISSEQGMSTFLSGSSDIASQIHETGVPNLFLVPAGPKAPNPSELINSERMLTGMLLMREYFTYVVVDSPPILELSDAMAASRHVDGVILVARCGKTLRKTVQRAADKLLQIGAKLFGVLVNDVKMEKAGYGYYGNTSGHFDHCHYPDSSSSQRSA